MTPGRLANVMLSGGMLIVSFQRSQAMVARSLGRTEVARRLF
jgi:hypothetical protein